MIRADPTIVDGKFLKIRQDTERKFRRPPISPELKRWLAGVLNVDSRFFCLNKEFAGLPNPKAVIRRFRRPPDFDGIFMDDILVRLGIALPIVHVPAETSEEWVQEFLSEASLVIGFLAECIEIMF